MAKSERGLPPSFELNIAGDAPARLGDYLDEPPARQVTVRKAPEVARRIVRENQPVIRSESVGEGIAKPLATVTPPAISPAIPAHITARIRKPPRRELNMRPETQRMFEELIDHVQTYSSEPNATASELFHALVTALYRAKDDVDLQRVPRRGQWGSVTARSFPDALADAFARGITAYFNKLRPA